MSADGQAVVNDLKRFTDLFDFTKHDLGELAAEALAVGVFETMEAQVDPDGNEWPPLSEAYAEEKARIAPGEPMAVLFGLMKDPDQLKGTREVQARTMTVTYGTTEEARQQASWFQEGNDRQPPRPFYSIGPVAKRSLDDCFDRHFESMFL